MYNYNFSFFTKYSILTTKRSRITSPLVSAAILYGLPFYVLFFIMVVIKVEIAYTEPLIYYSLLIASTWILLGPVLIVYWELSFNNYLEGLKKISKLNSKIKLNTLNKIYLNDKWRYISCFLLSLIFTFVIICGVDSVIKLGLNNGFKDPVFWITLFVSIQCGFTAGFGFWGIFKTIKSIILLKQYCDIEWKIFSYDKLGGLGFIYKFILNTTYCFSAGSLIIPFWLQIASDSNLLVIVNSYFLVALYSYAIFASFFIPSKLISGLIRNKVNNIMDEISIFLNGNFKKGTKAQEYSSLLSTYQYLYKYEITPLDYKKVAQFSMSFLVPLLLILIDIISQKIIGT